MVTRYRVHTSDEVWGIEATRFVTRWGWIVFYVQEREVARFADEHVIAVIAE